MRNEVTTATLKHIAITSMVIDHITQLFIVPLLEANGISNAVSFPVMLIGSLLIGRIAFVVFAYTCTLGVMNSGNVIKYLSRLFIFIFVSEVPYDLVRYGEVCNWNGQNIFLTLFLGTLTIVLTNFAETKILKTASGSSGKNRLICELVKIFIFIALMMCAFVLNTDYGVAGVLLIYLIYRNRYDVQNMIFFAFIPFILLLGVEGYFVANGGVITDIAEFIFSTIGVAITEVAGVFGFKLIAKYNGKRGRQLNKWFYYIFYPAHLLLIAVFVKLFV